MLIEKNGTQSLSQLAITNPEMFSIESSDYLTENNITSVTVFVREPISRVLSGLTTQMKLFELSTSVINNMLSNQKYFTIFDHHTVPQFWSMMRISKNDQIKFNIKPLTMLYEVDKNIKHLNTNTKLFQLTDDIKNKLVHFYTEDIVLHDQFLNTSCYLSDIIKQIKLEKNFIDDIQQYRHELTYLL